MIHLGRRLRHQDPHGMTVTQHLALATIAKRGEMAIGDLAEAERLPSSAATRLADRLEEAGLVARRRDPSDRRGVLVTITEEGRRVMDERRRVGNAWLAGRLSRLTPSQLVSLAEALDVIEEVALAEGGAGPRAGAAPARTTPPEAPPR
ncbi:MAG: MarR family transcriptional regulator [Candidatus Dormibacteria bacterium]